MSIRPVHFCIIIVYTTALFFPSKQWRNLTDPIFLQWIGQRAGASVKNWCEQRLRVKYNISQSYSGPSILRQNQINTPNVYSSHPPLSHTVTSAPCTQYGDIVIITRFTFHYPDVSGMLLFHYSVASQLLLVHSSLPLSGACCNKQALVSGVKVNFSLHLPY